jgi:hypothetical protein
MQPVFVHRTPKNISRLILNTLLLTFVVYSPSASVSHATLQPGSRTRSHLFREPFPFLEQKMTPRSIRRAAERKANKLARKAAQQNISPNMQAPENYPAETEFPTEESASETPAKTPTLTIIPPAAAADANLSAVASALTGHATLLPTSDAAQYGQLLRDYQNEFQPVGMQESNLVQTLAETTWRTRRTLALEMAIFAKGHIEFAPQFAEHNPDIRVSLIEVHTFLTYEKQIRSLQLQEARLARRADRASAELRDLQKEHRQREQNQQRQPESTAQNQLPFHPIQATGQNGFVFSNPETKSSPAPKQATQDQFIATLGLSIGAKAA